MAIWVDVDLRYDPVERPQRPQAKPIAGSPNHSPRRTKLSFDKVKVILAMDMFIYDTDANFLHN